MYLVGFIIRVRYLVSAKADYCTQVNALNVAVDGISAICMTFVLTIQVILNF